MKNLFIFPTTVLSLLSVLMSSILLPLFSSTITAFAQEISEECRAETEPLLQDSSLEIAQSIIFEDYMASYMDVCEFGLDNVGCSIKFEGDERTYRALCAGQGGKVYKRPVVLKCAFGAYEYDLGYIPTCVGGSCNITNVGPGDVETEQVDEFLNNLTFTGCKADASSAERRTKNESSLLWSLTSSLWGFSVFAMAFPTFF